MEEKKINYIELIYNPDNEHKKIIIKENMIGRLELNDITYSSKMLNDGTILENKRCNDFLLCINRNLIDNEIERQLDLYVDLTKIIIYYLNGKTESYNLIYQRYSTEIEDKRYHFNTCLHTNYEIDNRIGVSYFVIKVKELSRYYEGN